MADLNKKMMEVQKRSQTIKMEIKDLLNDYDQLFREVNALYMDDRNETGTTAGLEDCYRLLQIIRRNRDVMSALFRGANGFRPIDKFKFIEEETTAPKEKPKEEAVSVPDESILKEFEEENVNA